MKAVDWAKKLLPSARAIIIFVSTCEDVDALKLRLSRTHAKQCGEGGTDEEMLEWGMTHMAWFCTAGEKHKDVEWQGNTKDPKFRYALTTTRAL